MSTCQCCLLSDAGLFEASLGFIDGVISLNTDVSVEILWEDPRFNMCDNKELYFFGPGKGTFQIQAYPFHSLDDFKYCFTCPTEVSMQTPWKYIYDCNKIVPCVNGGNRRGAWVGIPMVHKTITVTGDLTDSVLPFEIGGCGIEVLKFNIQASNMPILKPLHTHQYTWLSYTGFPIPFDTRTPYIYDLQLKTGAACDDDVFPMVQVFLTGFTFNFTPPKIPVVTYNFDLNLSLCPDCG